MIRFYAKIAGQKVMSAVPGGLRLYHGMQEHVTRSTVPTPTRVRQKVDVGLSYLGEFEALAGDDALRTGVHVDIGAGWHFTIPLLFWQLGCDRQFLVDVRAWARADSVFEVARLLGACDVGGRPRRALPEPGKRTLSQYLTLLGITYLAPVPGRLPLRDACATLVTSTQTLLHPPRAVVRSIFEESARVLRPGGLFGATVHLYDLYSDFDDRLNRFNFLRYDEREWERWFNSSLMGYNRLRASDYAGLLAGLPLRAERWEITGPAAEDLRELGRMPLAGRFAEYATEDLAGTHLMFVLRRA